MDWFMKILGLVIALLFLVVGLRFFFVPERIIRGIQQYKFKTTAKPRKQEILFSKIIGVLLTLIGLYFLGVSIYSFFVV